MTVETFDDFLSSEFDRGNTSTLKPFQFRDDPQDEKKTLEWLVENFNRKQKAAFSRLSTYKRNLALYKGIHWKSQDVRDYMREDDNLSQRKPRMTVNFIYEMVEAKVSQMARLRASIALIPNNDQANDINNAKSCKKLLDARADKIRLEQLHQEADRIKYIFGHVFQYVEWCEDEGPLHPKYLKSKQRYGEKIPKLDENGKPIKGKFIKESIHIGDVEVENLAPDRVFPELDKTSWREINEVDITEWVDIDELKAEYPDKKNDIQENDRQMYDYETFALVRPYNKVQVREFYHRKTSWLPTGAKIKYTDDCILSWEEYPYDEDCLPLVQDTDIDIYGELWGRSFIGNIDGLQKMYNNLQSATARDYNIASAPKWMVPKGACDFHDLNNELTIVEYTGPAAPVLVESKPTSSQTFEIQDRLEKKIAQHSGVYDISRGEVPPGITANSALRFLDEQESQRTFVAESKRKKRVIEVYRLMIKRMAQFYKESDDRTLRILGEDNSYLIESMKKANFNEVYDIKFQNAPALPDTKTGKISAIIDLNTATQTDPIFRKEEIVQMLDLGLDDAFKDDATIAVTSAKMVLEKMLSGEKVPDPQPYDNLLVHYNIFIRKMQELSYKTKVPAKYQVDIELRVKMLEALMYRRMQKNPKFAMEISNLDNFPVFFEIPAPPPVNTQNNPQAGKGGGADLTKTQKIPEQNMEP